MNSNLRVLVADDEPIIRDIIGDILACEEEGVEVETAGTCMEVLRRIQEKEFDVIFLDVCMKDGDGVELLRKIRGDRPAPRIYMITGYGVGDRIEDALASGASGAIDKPFTVAEIRAALYGTGPESASLSE
jgi:CheY-like chemotaxis protein